METIYVTNGVDPQDGSAVPVPIETRRELIAGAEDFGVSPQQMATLVLVGWGRRRQERRDQERRS